MAQNYKYLISDGISLTTVWAWAKQLVTELNKSVPAAVPTGATMGWANGDAPEGWLLTDGASYTTAAYPELFLKIGYTYGGSGMSFNVPNAANSMIKA
jgi:hypothetical protein